MVEGDVSNRCGLFLDPRLPAGHCLLGRRRAVAFGYTRARPIDTLRSSAHLAPRR